MGKRPRVVCSFRLRARIEIDDPSISKSIGKIVPICPGANDIGIWATFGICRFQEPAARCFAGNVERAYLYGTLKTNIVVFRHSRGRRDIYPVR